MKISKVGGVIAAASNSAAFPLGQIGDISNIMRIVLSYQQAGIFPIVVVTGNQEDEVRYQLSSIGIVFLLSDETEAPELIKSARLGLSFLEDKCEKIVFTPVNVPMFSPKTLHALIEADGEIVTPSYHKKGGHPVCLSSDVVPDILAYKGGGGLRCAIASMEEKRQWVEVDDECILFTVHEEDKLKKYIDQHNREILRPAIKLSLERDSIFFNTRTKLLLLLVAHAHSLRSACDLMSISYSKAWDMINKLENELGYLLVLRKHGGKRGGRTDLTEEGYRFLKAYQAMEENIFDFTRKQFEDLLVKPGIL